MDESEIIKKKYSILLSNLECSGLSQNDAEDICQETFLKAILQNKPIEEIPLSWFCRVAKNIYLNTIKHNNRQIPVEQLEILEDDMTSIIDVKLDSTSQIFSNAVDEILHPNL